VTITDLKKGDIVDLAGTVTAGALGAKADVSAATTLAEALNLANGDTVAGASGAGAAGAAKLVWFQYAGNTYIYSDVANSTDAYGTVDAADNIVALTGLVDLIGSTFTTAAALTIA
jgi:hypothetical protein